MSTRELLALVISAHECLVYVANQEDDHHWFDPDRQKRIRTLGSLICRLEEELRKEENPK